MIDDGAGGMIELNLEVSFHQCDVSELERLMRLKLQPDCCHRLSNR